MRIKCLKDFQDPFLDYKETEVIQEQVPEKMSAVKTKHFRQTTKGRFIDSLHSFKDIGELYQQEKQDLLKLNPEL